jgi:putative copper export protein
VETIAFVRAIHFAGILLPPAILFFQSVIARPAWRGSDELGRVILADLEKSLLWVALTAAVAAFLSGLAWLFLVTGKMSDAGLNLQILETVVTETHFGKSWSLHLPVILLLCGLLGLLLRQEPGGGLLMACWLFAVGGLVSTAFAGHAAATASPVISITVDALHLLAASLWPAGLFSMAIYLARMRKFPELNAVTSTMTERFSRMSLISVPILALTGLLNSWLITGRFSPFQSAYGRILLAKILVFGMMLVIGAVNLWRIKPRFRCSAPETGNVATTLVLNVSTETCLGCVVLILTGILGQTSPR